jgi:hypothetical protein
MKKNIIFIPMILILLIAAACSPAVDIDFVAEAVNSDAGSLLRSIDMGNGVVVDEYNVTFYKIEIGNSEDDKFTLWENTAGETKNLVGSVTFTDINEVITGSYEFCRLTIDKTLELKGVDGSTAGTVTYDVSGNFENNDPEAVFLFGTENAPGSLTGNFLLTDTIEVYDGATLTFTVNIAGTVTGDGSGNISLSEPSLTFTTE